MYKISIEQMNGLDFTHWYNERKWLFKVDYSLLDTSNSFPPLNPRHEEGLRISPAFEVGEFIQLFLSLYKPRSLAIENKSTFFEMIKFFWRTKKRRYIPFLNY